MKYQKRLSLFALITLLTLLANLIFPVSVLADDETPPPAPTEEIISDEETPAPDASVDTTLQEPTGEPAPVSEILEQLPENTDLIVLDESGEALPLVTQAAATVMQEGDPIWCPTGQTPGGAGCTPLMTNFTGPAADGLIRYLAINEGIYNGAGTIYVTSTLSALDTAAGTIGLFANTTNLDQLTDLTIEGGWNGLTGASFALNGQSNFGATRLHIGTDAINWNGNVTLNNISFSGVSSGHSVTVFTNSGNITLNNVDVANQAGDARSANLNSVTGNIIVQNGSSFDGNASADSRGFHAETDGSITITDTTFSEATNSDIALNINGATLTGSTVYLEDVSATDNDFNGIKINSTSDVTLDNVTASGNGADGVKIDANGGNALVENSLFYENDNNGIGIVTANGYIELNNTTAYENLWNGANLVSAGNITVSGGSYYNNDRRGILLEATGGDVLIEELELSGNDYAGIYAEIFSNNNFTLDHVISDGNGNYGVYVDTLGNVVIQGGSQLINNGAAGLYIEETTDLNINDDATYGGSLFSNNTGHGLYAYSVYGNVYIENGTFTLNDLRGLSLPYVEGSVTIISSDFLQNLGGGAYIDNCGCIPADINITSSNFNENGWTGLEVYSYGDINLTNVNANDNDQDGAYVDNSFGTGEVSITNSQFNTNDSLGLVVSSTGNINLTNVTANDNWFLGASLQNCGCLGGAAGITITGINAFSNNGFIGLEFASDGEVLIENVTANNNGFGGIGGDTFGNITVINAVVSNNPYGLGFGTNGDVTIQCSIVTNNTIEGVGVDATNLNLIGVTFSNNGLDYENFSGAVNVFDYNCTPANNNINKPSGGSGLPLQIVQGGSADLDCERYSGTVLILPNGDKVTFKCPIRGSATLDKLATEILPKELPEGVEYVSGLVAVPSPDGSDVALEGLVIISFIIPEDLKGADFAILYWDGNEWLDLDTATFSDGRNVSNGGYVTTDGYFEAFTNFSGNFVLVTK